MNTENGMMNTDKTCHAVVRSCLGGFANGKAIA